MITCLILVPVTLSLDLFSSLGFAGRSCPVGGAGMVLYTTYTTYPASVLLSWALSSDANGGKFDQSHDSVSHSQQCNQLRNVLNGGGDRSGMSKRQEEDGAPLQWRFFQNPAACTRWDFLNYGQVMCLKLYFFFFFYSALNRFSLWCRFIKHFSRY